MAAYFIARLRFLNGLHFQIKCKIIAITYAPLFHMHNSLIKIRAILLLNLKSKVVSYFEEFLRERERERYRTLFFCSRSHREYTTRVARSGTVEEREEKRNTHRRTHRVESSVTCLPTSPLGTLVECGVRQGGEAVKSIQCFCFK